MIQKTTNEREGKMEWKLDAAFRTVIRIRKSFPEASRNFTPVFLFNKAG
jgi:hypothetical protein